jgi:biotin-dependent carboxylase-like uncharacterized protein
VLTVLDAGPLTTVQDLGRPGLAHLGVPRSGALDAVSAAAANRLVGNEPAAAVLETAVGGCTVRFARAVTIAVTGAPCGVEVDGRAGPHGVALTVAAGTTLRLGPATAGVRSYLAVTGGIDVPPVLGSRSTDLLSALGPAPLRRGDVLAVGTAAVGPPVGADVPVLARLPGPEGVVVRVWPGPRADWFTDDAWRILLTSGWTVAGRSDRTAISLEVAGQDGQVLERAVTGELPSEGLVLGAVQVPTTGAAVIFLADHPVSGGYPVMAVVDPGDLGVLAQCAPGTRLRFRRSAYR